ncbi:SDR family NAD(P)-dependent oxidoreductase [Longivirga aurantiaca]|uniref:SDR family NAD(P)-dependent oxidoreductase n=1 Tax=Longivirga aurantiaca TaxID=1837743 RepID=A0ABW1T570_9ACTN
MSALGAGSLVVVTGAGGPAGTAMVRALIETGAHVAAADRTQSKLDALGASLGDGAARFRGTAVDLLDSAAVRAWADAAAASHPSGAPRVDGVIHLVGGWRGGKGFLDNTVADSELMLDLLVRTLQHVSLAYHDHLVASPRSEFVIVSAAAAEKPTAGNAAYAAAKSAAEAWTAALADSFGKLAPESAAATTLVVKALVHDEMRAADPSKTFPGYTDVADLAAETVALWSLPAAEANGLRKVLVP